MKYRFDLKLLEHSEMEIVEIENTKTNLRKLIRGGDFAFTADGVDCRLQADKSVVFSSILKR